MTDAPDVLDKNFALCWLLAEARHEAEHYRDRYDAGSSMISEGYARSRLPWEGNRG